MMGDEAGGQGFPVAECRELSSLPLTPLVSWVVSYLKHTAKIIS